MTLETAAVEFLRAHVAWKRAKRATQGLPRCTNRNPTTYLNGGVLDFGNHECFVEHVRPNEDWCENCLKREPLMAERRAALKTYNQARRRALRALKKETP